jgi:hypothetical protein
VAFVLIFLLFSLPDLHSFPLLYLSVVFICHPSSLHGHLFTMPPQWQYRPGSFNEYRLGKLVLAVRWHSSLCIQEFKDHAKGLRDDNKYNH